MICLAYSVLHLFNNMAYNIKIYQFLHFSYVFQQSIDTSLYLFKLFYFDLDLCGIASGKLLNFKNSHDN